MANMIIDTDMTQRAQAGRSHHPRGLPLQARTLPDSRPLAATVLQPLLRWNACAMEFGVNPARVLDAVGFSVWDAASVGKLPAHRRALLQRIVDELGQASAKVRL